jgi:hypothetical protein
MTRQRGLDNSDPEWMNLVWAGGAAVLVTFVLVVGVAMAWIVGGSASSPPALTGSVPLTPTPRAISFARSTPTPASAAEAAAVADTTTSHDSRTVGKPAEFAAWSTDNAAGEGNSPSFNAASGGDFQGLASGSWSVSGDALVNDGSQAVSEHWLPLTPVANPNFAVETQIRVTGTLPSVCDQSFGITGGSPSAGLVFGGGVIFPCGGGPAMARVTNATDWEDGYNADPVIAEKAFTPGEDWHTYRFELRGAKIRLLVDGVAIVNGVADPSIDPATTDAEAGLWSQGVGLEVKRVAVLPLPK